jgi:hypothetical protein
VFEEKVSDPGKGVTLNQRSTGKPPFLRNRRGNEQREGDARSGEVQPTLGGVRMLAEIERIEFTESAIFLFVVHRMRTAACEGDLFCQTGFDPVEAIFVEMLRR